MKPQFDSHEACQICGRHCLPDDLHCPRGKAYFGQKTEEMQHSKERQGVNSKDETVMMMLKCGHFLHHGLRERAESEDILAFLSSDEKTELTAILKKCINEWENY